MKKAKIAVIGGGIAGSSITLVLGRLGLDITLFEKRETLVDGPPICHLHAGGNLYREISDAQCLQLLKESIEFVRLYPYAVDVRPTVIAVPKSDKGEPKALFSRLERLKEEYKNLVELDDANRVLGEVDAYYKIYDRETMERLKEQKVKENPKTFDEWMLPVAKSVDFEKLKFPLVMVAEYGLNIFKLASSVTLALEKLQNITLQRTSIVKNISQEGSLWSVEFLKKGSLKKEKFNYLINAAGFQSGKIDDMLGLKRERFVEFKAAYVTKWKSELTWPEIIFYGERGTPEGMAQFTPYSEGYFQLHGMSESITLFQDGLVQSSALSSQPELDKKFIEKLEKGWKKEEVDIRTQGAIEHLTQYIPTFFDAKSTKKPLYGAQQIPGNDASLRAAEVSFDGKRYARCEIVKASSVLAMADAISQKLIELDYLDASLYKKREFFTSLDIDDAKLVKLSKTLTRKREYPEALADVKNSFKAIKKISNIRTKIEYIALKKPFITALRRVEKVEFVRVFIESNDGTVGIGEAPATLAITGEDIEKILSSIDEVKEQLIDLSLDDAMKILHQTSIGSSAKASIDMAIFSLKNFFQLRELQAIETDITISLNEPEKMLADAREALLEGMDILKIKLGKSIRHAIEVTKLLASELPKAKLLIDANQAWSLEESLEYLKAIKHLNIELIEQPVKAKELEALKIITNATKIPILADEAVFTLNDVKKVVESASADMINIKLMKCGGVSKAVEILEYAREKGVTCMLGSMLEGPYSINAALYLAFNYRDVIKYIDLDSPLLYKEDAKELDFKFEKKFIKAIL